MPKVWRLVDSGLVAPAESAALDEAILEAHAAGKVPNTLHLYRRRIPTISVGHFQKVAETLDRAECDRRGVAIVRRKSGGSSIYTDQGQLIYALVVSERDLPKERSESFKLVCGAIARAITSLGLDARYRPVNDVEVGGKKVSGNAQLRRKGSVLQHGTIVVDADIETMDSVLVLGHSKDSSVTRPSDRVTTLSRLLGSVPDMETVKAGLVSELAVAFGVGFSEDSLTALELQIVKELVLGTYSREDWNFRF